MTSFGIKKTSLRVLKNIYDYAIEVNNLDSLIPQDQLLKDIQEIDTNSLVLCLQYLQRKKLINNKRKDDDCSRYIELSAEAIDFMEG